MAGMQGGNRCKEGDGSLRIGIAGRHWHLLPAAVGCCLLSRRATTCLPLLLRRRRLLLLSWRRRPELQVLRRR